MLREAQGPAALRRDGAGKAESFLAQSIPWHDGLDAAVREDEAARGRGSQLLLRASQEAAFYLLNRKRAELAEIEERYGVMIEVAADGEQEGARMSVEASGPPPA